MKENLNEDCCAICEQQAEVGIVRLVSTTKIITNVIYCNHCFKNEELI